MTYGQDDGQRDPREQWPPQYGQSGPWQQEGQGGPWQPGQYDPGAHQQRFGQPPQQPYSAQGQPWPQQGYPPPQGPPGWQPTGYGQQPPWGPPPGAPQPPRRRRHTARNVLIGLGSLLVLLVVIGIAANSGHTTSNAGAIGTAGSSAIAASTTAPPSAAPTAATQAAAAVTDPNGQQCASLDSLGYCPGDDPSPMQQWCDSTGYDGFQSVQSDLSQLGQDAGDDDLAAVEQDGATLAQDASSVESSLPPLSNAHKVTFGVWMGYMSLAGIKASQGDIDGASGLLEDATQYNSIVTYVSNQCGGN